MHGRKQKTLRATREAEGNGASSTTPAIRRWAAKYVATAVPKDWSKEIVVLPSIPIVLTRYS